MSENMSFGDWKSVTPEAMKSYSEEKLHLAMQLNNGGVYDTWARAELQRRQNERLMELLHHLESAIWKVEQQVITLSKSSTALLTSTDTLVKETTNVHSEVARLTGSSTKLEKLTIRLNRLTWVLVLLTFFAVCVPIGIEVWKAYHEPESEPVLTQPKPSQ
jgi:hypothetical protein